MKKKGLLLIHILVFIFGLTFDLRAQTDQVSGRVIAGTDRQPLPGAYLSTGTREKIYQADDQGHFSFRLQERKLTLTVYMMGFDTLKLQINESTVFPLELVLMPKITSLQEVRVSTGYTTLPKERATGAFASIQASELDLQPATGIAERLEGKVAGLTLNKSSYGPPSISIRGLSTIFADAKPLIIVDNFPFDGDLNSLNPQDIQKIDILKDATAASIWGVRSGNGVIVIQTKKGRYGQKLSFSGNMNIRRVEKPDLSYFPMLGSKDFIAAESQLFRQGYYLPQENNRLNFPALSPVVELLISQRDGLITGQQADQALARLAETSVLGELSKHFFRAALKQQYSMNLSGGGQNQHFIFAASYDKNRENQVRNDYNRFTLRAANTVRFGRKISASSSVMITGSNTAANTPGAGSLLSVGTKGIFPYAALADQNGLPLAVSRSFRESFKTEAEKEGYLNWDYKPLQELMLADKKQSLFYSRINAKLEYEIGRGLKAEALYQYERSSQTQTDRIHADSYYARDLVNKFTTRDGSSNLVRNIPPGGILDQELRSMDGQSGRLQLNYNYSKENTHRLDALAGVELKELVFSASQRRLYAYDDNILTSGSVNYRDIFTLYPLSTRESIPDPRKLSHLTDRYLSSYINANYTYKQAYSISGSARIDQSNYFGAKANNRRLPLWSAGLSWSPEVKRGKLTFLKVRATYGFNGNIDKSLTALTTMRYSTLAATTQPIATLVNPPNENLRWEKTGTINLGLDINIGNQGLSASLDYYLKKGTDLIGMIPVARTNGLTSFKGNVADMRGNGIDLEIRNTFRNNHFRWQSKLLLSINTSKVTRYSLAPYSQSLVQLAAGSPTATEPVPMEGKPVYGLYSYRSAGLDPATGNPRGYVNNEISQDYAAILTQTKPDDLIFHGSAIPTCFGAFINTLSYKDFSLTLAINYKLGYKFRRSSVDYYAFFQDWRAHSDFASRWKVPGDEKITNVPSMPATLNYSRESFYANSEALVEDGSHFRLQYINLAYRLGKTELYMNLDNPAILWRANKHGIDPDFIPSGSYTVFLPERTSTLGIRFGL